MKILIAYYSLTGNVGRIADAIMQATGGEIMEVKTKRALPSKGFAKYFWGGKQVVKKETPELLPLEKNPSDFDLIFIGTPVWAANFTPAIRSFLGKVKLQNKKIALFCSHGGESAGATLANLEKELAGNEIVGKIDFKMDGISGAQEHKNLEEVKSWAAKLTGGTN